MAYDPEKLAYARSLNTDETIAQALSQKEGFDLNENLQRGHSYTDIVDHLALGNDLKPKLSLGAKVGQLLGSAAVGTAEGLTTELPSMVGSAMQFVGDKTGAGFVEDSGKSIKEWSAEKSKDWYGEQPERTGLNRAVYEGTKMLAPSIIPGAASVTGAKMLFGVGKLAKAAKLAQAAGDAVELAKVTAKLTSASKAAMTVGSAAPAVLLYGTSQAQQTIDSANNTARELRLKGDEAGAKKAEEAGQGITPYITGAIEAAGEYYGTKYLGKLFGVAEGQITKRTMKELGMDFLKTLGVEGGTEFGQAIGESAVEKKSGIRPDAHPLDEALDVLGPTAIMTIITGGLAAGANTFAPEAKDNPDGHDGPGKEPKEVDYYRAVMPEDGSDTPNGPSGGLKKGETKGVTDDLRAGEKGTPTLADVSTAITKAAAGEGSFDDALVMALELDQEDPATKQIIVDIQQAEEKRLTDVIEQQGQNAVSDGSGDSAGEIVNLDVTNAEIPARPKRVDELKDIIKTAQNSQEVEKLRGELPKVVEIQPELAPFSGELLKAIDDHSATLSKMGNEVAAPASKGILDKQYRKKSQANKVISRAVKRKIIKDGEYSVVPGDGGLDLIKNYTAGRQDKKGEQIEATSQADQKGEKSRETSQAAVKGEERVDHQINNTPDALHETSAPSGVTNIEPEIINSKSGNGYKTVGILKKAIAKQEKNVGDFDILKDDNGRFTGVRKAESASLSPTSAKIDVKPAEIADTGQAKISANDNSSNKTVTVNDQEITLTPEQQVEWDKGEAGYKRELELNQLNHGDNAVMRGKKNKASAMRWAKQKRQITNTLTPKEQQAEKDFNAKIRKGDRVSYVDDSGVKREGVVDRNPTFGQVKIVESNGDIKHISHKKVTKEQQTTEQIESPVKDEERFRDKMQEVIKGKLADLNDTPEPAPVKAAGGDKITSKHGDKQTDSYNKTDADLLQDAAEAQARASDRGDDVAVRMLQKTIDSIRAKINSQSHETGQDKTTVKQEDAGKTSSDIPSPEDGPSHVGSSWGKDNKLVSQERADELRKKLREKLSQLNSGIDPALLGMGIELGVYHLEAGARSFVSFAKKMSADLGEKGKPYLKAWYMGAKNWPGVDKTGMDSEATVDALNVDDFVEDVDNQQQKSDNKSEGEKANEGKNIRREAVQAVTTTVARRDAQGTREDDNLGDSGEKPTVVQGTPRERGAAKVRDDARGSDVQGVRGTGRSDKLGDGRKKSTVHGKGTDSQHNDTGSVAQRHEKQPRVLDHRINEGGLKREGSWRETAGRNLDIIELVKKLEEENRQATPEEKILLAKYTGFGASEIANKLFPGYAEHGRIMEGWATEPWKELVERINSLLTPEELRTAAKSTQYAHYTSEPIIRSIYKAMGRFGFMGGNILEPGAGPAAFWGLTPDNIYKKSNYTGIEMDHITASVAKHLYPNQNIIHADFTKQLLPDGFFDVGIGNPPFSGTVIVSDPVYKKNRFKLHDYFFAKTIDKVRPGGLLVFVTSRYTMDKADSKARDYLSERADLLGAIRLPQTAFKENAGTDVVTDVIFLKKREDNSKPSSTKWRELSEVQTEDGSANINEYFVDHPEMILGVNSLQGSMYQGNEYTVVPHDDGNIEEHFRKAVQLLPKNVYKTAQKTSNERVKVAVEVDFNPKNKKEGGVYLDDSGNLMRVKDGAGKDISGFTKKPLTIKEKNWLKGYVGLRDAMKQAQYDQLNDLEWENSLKELNRVYDAFVKKHGTVGSYTISESTSIDEDGNEKVRVTRREKNKKLLALDVESPMVKAIEEDLGGGKLGKNAFLTQRTIMKPTRQTPTNLGDALALSLDETGGLDLNHIAESLDITQQEVVEGLGDQIYRNPATKEWETADQYLSGDVLQKLEEAQVAARVDDKFKRNLEPLIKVQPAPLTPRDMTISLGSSFIDPSVIQQFAGEVLGIEVRAQYLQAVNHWKAALRNGGAQSLRRQTSEWGTTDKGPNEILEAVLNNRSLKITRKIDKKTVTDQDATTAVNDIAKKMREKFSTWVWSDAKRAAEISGEYNRRFNNIAPRKFDGSHLTLPGVSLKFKLHPHQKTAIWRAIQDGNAYFAHAVGAGKTIEMIASGMEMRRLGLIQKPVYVVPKHMLQQFSNEFMELYPMANLSVADEEHFHTDNRRSFMSQVALNSPDAIIITHPSLGKISVKEDSVNKVKESMIDDLRASLAELKDDDETKNRFLIKKVEKRIEKLEQMFDSMVASNKDNVISFEDMGIDFMFVDEAHEFRKLDFVTNRQAKGIDSNGSKKTLDLYIKTKFLEGRSPGRSHIFASGTPVTNTMGELYTLMRFFDEEGMEADGIKHFDAWANMFGEVAPGFERNAAGNYEVVERFAKFVNVPELMKRVRSFMDVLGFKDLGSIVKRPSVIGGHPQMVLSKQSSAMKHYLSSTLAHRIQVSRDWRPSKDQPGNPDPIINIITDGRLASIDMRFVDNSLPNDPDSKLNTMIDGIIKTWKDTKNLRYINSDTGKNELIRGGTQIVFYNNGFGKGIIKSRGFDSKSWLMNRLKKAGVPLNQVAWIEDYATAAKKEELFKDVRSGKVKILIGSAKKMGTGVNVQRRLRTLHYMDAPWYPADVEQPLGRILRQGNLNDEVNINWYATEGSYDSTMWQMVARKSKFIEQALTGDDSVRTLEDISEASSYDMATALSSGDERVIQLAGINADIERLSGLRRAHFREQLSLKAKKSRLVSDIKHYQIREKEFKDAEGKVGGYVRDIDGVVDGKRFDNRKEFGAAIQKKFLDVADKQSGDKKFGVFDIGKINGFPVVANIRATRQEMLVVVSKEVKLEIDEVVGSDVGLASKIVNALNSLGGQRSNISRHLTENRQELARVDNRIGAPFEYDAELHAKTAEAATLEGELAETETENNTEERGDQGAENGQEGSYSRTNKEPWADDFPNAVLHTQLNTMRGKLDKKTKEIIPGTGHPDYKAAKSGDHEAAYRLVADLAKIPQIKELFAKFPDAMLAAPHAEEESGRNAIPRAMAEFMAGVGFKVDTDIVQTNKAARTKKGSALRLAVRPEFGGKVIKGQQYILVDDALGMGGTVSELRHYIESNGGRVVHVSALTSGIFGNKLSITDTTITKLQEKFGSKELEDFLYEFNIAGSVKALTNKEGRYILGRPSLDGLRDKILTEARQANISPTAWQVKASFSRITEEADELPGRGQSGKVTLRSEILRRKLAKDFGVEIPKGKITEILVRDILPSSGTTEGAGTSVSSNRNNSQVISAAEIANRVAKIFGKKIVFFKDDFGLKINGAHFSGDTIYINIDANNPYLAITGHELLHTLKKEHPGLYAKLRTILEHEMKASEFVGFREWLSAKTVSEGRKSASDELVYEEMAANFLGDQMMKPEFWNKVRGENPSLFEKIVSFVKSFIDKIRRKSAMRDLHSSNYFRNIETVQDAMAKAVAGYGESRNSNAFKDGSTDKGEIKYSRQEYLDDLFGIAKDITNKIKGKDGKTTYVDGKEDINYFDVVFSTIEHYARKVPVIERYIDVILSRVDRKFKLETEMLNASGEDAIKVLEGLRKTDKKGYEKLKKYLLSADRNRSGFTMRRGDDETWAVFAPRLDEPIAKGLGEVEAVSYMVEAEADYVAKEKGFSGDMVSALINFRAVMNKGFDQLVAQLRALEEDAKANNQEPPTVEVEAAEKRWAIYKDNPDLAVAIFRSKQEAQLVMSQLKNSTKARKRYHLNLFYKAGRSVKLVERTAKQMKDDPKTETISLSEAIAQMGDMRGTYFPRQRESGELVMVATKDGENPIMKKFDWGSAAMKGDTKTAKTIKGIFNSFSPMGFEIRRLEKKGYKVEVKRDQSISEDLFDVTKLVMSVEGVLQDAAKQSKTGESEINEHVNQILINSVADIFKGRGYLSSRIQRNKRIGDDVYLGYEEDPLVAMTKYAKSMAGGMAKRDVAKEATLILIGKDISWKDYQAEHADAEYASYLKMVQKRRLDPGTQKTAYYAVMTHYREQMRNEERIDRAIGTLKGLAVLKFLGFRVSSAAINLTNMAIAVPSVMAGIGKIPFHKTWGYIGRSGLSYTDFLRGKASVEEKKVFDEIHANGWDEAQFNMDSARVLQSRFGQGFDWFMAKAMVMFGATEKVNRATTIFAAYQALVKEKGLSHDEAMKEAKDISDKAHGVYGKATMPHLAMGKGPGQMALRLAYVFQKFSHNYLLTLKRLGWDEKEYVAMAHMLIAPAIMAGAGASVITPFIAAAAKALGIGDDDDPEEGLYNWADRTFGGGDWLRHGVVGLGGRGVNLKGSLQINFGGPTSIAELLGAPMGVLTDVWRGFGELGKGNISKGAEQIMPTGIAAPFKALREYKEGVTTRSNAPIFFGNDPVKGTAMDAAIRFIAFNPSRLSGIREKQWSDKKVARDYSDDRGEISGKIKRYRLQEFSKRDPGDWAEILAEIYEYNERVVSSGRDYIPVITGKTIRRIWMNAGRPPRRERLRAINQ